MERTGGFRGYRQQLPNASR
ncbi:hypothetical protein CISIN_1g0264692mg, partial [Citrus sinensis]